MRAGDSGQPPYMWLTLDMVPAACQSEPGSVLEVKSSLVDVESAEPVCVCVVWMCCGRAVHFSEHTHAHAVH